MTDFRMVYLDFVNWYGSLFGEAGLFSFTQNTYMDGNETVTEFVTQVFGQPTEVAAIGDVSVGIPFQFEQVIDWVGSKFGVFLQEEACTLCTQFTNATIAPLNETNSTSGV